jgi:hypothetical protein
MLCPRTKLSADSIACFQLRVDPAFHNFAILDALDGDPADRYLLAGRGKALKVAITVDGPQGYAGRDLIPFGDLVFYREMVLTESRVPRANPLQMRIAVLRTGRVGPISHEIGRQHLVEGGLIASNCSRSCAARPVGGSVIGDTG